jgi:hypothetical protein
MCCAAVAYIASPRYSLSDPESEVPFAQALYGNDKFMRAFFNSLSDDGILVMQLGEAPTPGSPDETYSKFKNRATTTKLLASLGFESIHAYEEVSAWGTIVLYHGMVAPILSNCSLYYDKLLFSLIVGFWLHGHM